MLAGDITIVLAQNILISDVPTQPYILKSAAPGDANDDGKIDATDITALERIIIELDTQTPGADANQDGAINALDITKLERIIVGLN